MIPLDDLSPATVAMFARLLVASRWRMRRAWPHIAIVLTPESKRVMLRADLANYFRANGLPKLAHEVLTRRVPPGCVLVHHVRDDADDAAAALVVVDLAVELARVRSLAP